MFRKLVKHSKTISNRRLSGMSTECQELYANYGVFLLGECQSDLEILFGGEDNKDLYGCENELFDNIDLLCATESCFTTAIDHITALVSAGCLPEDDSSGPCDDEDEVEINEGGNTYCFETCTGNADCCSNPDNDEWANCTTDQTNNYCRPNDMDDADPETEEMSMDMMATMLQNFVAFMCLKDPANPAEYCIPRVMGVIADTDGECSDLASTGCCVGTVVKALGCFTIDAPVDGDFGTQLSTFCPNVDVSTTCSGTPGECASASAVSVSSLLIAASMFLVRVGLA